MVVYTMLYAFIHFKGCGMLKQKASNKLDRALGKIISQKAPVLLPLLVPSLGSHEMDGMDIMLDQSQGRSNPAVCFHSRQPHIKSWQSEHNCYSTLLLMFLSNDIGGKI